MARQLHLLAEEIRRKRKLQFVLTRSAPDADRNVGELIDIKVRGDLALRAAEAEQSIALRLGPEEAHIARQELTARKKKL